MRNDLERRFSCNRCRKTFESEDEILDHLETDHSGESDGKYDYSVNITSEYP